MSKRTNKDIKITTAELSSSKCDTGRLPADQSCFPALSVEPAAGKKRSAKRAAKTAVVDQDASVQNDPELEKLLLQVDHMLTEMTQSKWLSSDWPSLEIDFGNSKK